MENNVNEMVLRLEILKETRLFMENSLEGVDVNKVDDYLKIVKKFEQFVFNYQENENA